ncbi:MAG: CoA transferase [Alphaproteobacteria bacterium]|nr:CoA transferase [Alphaproteobacteria bacterium]
MQRPLSGMNVLAVEQYGAGPFGTQHLADLGAQVIKIENHRTGGDYARALGPHFADGAQGDEGSLFFQAVNRNKKSLSLDLSRAEGRDVLHRLVTSVDAVANNLRGDVPEKLGITYDQLKDVNPAIVCGHCSAYGRDGPRRDWPGYDFLMQAEAGYFHMSGEPDTPPTRMGLSVVDFMAGTYLALGLVSGVLAARATGQGRNIDVNLYDTALFNMSYLAAWTLNSDYEPSRAARSAHASLVPCQLYRTADGWIYIMCNKEKFWQGLCRMIDRPDLASESRFRTFEERLEHRDMLTTILDEALSTRTTAAWLDIFAGQVPSAPVRTPREALLDPSVKSSGMLSSVSLPSGEGFDLLANPIQTGGDGSDAACPVSGADTRHLLLLAGYSDMEIQALEEKGII